MVSNKKGISAIVATVLIVLITVAGVAIIWVAIVPMINERVDFEATDVRLSIVTSGGYTAYDPDSGLMVVQVKRGADDNQSIDYIELNVVVGGNTEKFSGLRVPGPNQAKVYYLNVSGKPDSVSVAGVVGRGEDRLESKPISSKLDNLPKGSLNEETLVEEGVIIYSSGSANINSYDCKKVVDGRYVNVPEGVECSLGECDGSGGCFECVKDSTCDDEDFCTADSCSGNFCLNEPITSCSLTADGCCPSACNDNNDADCNPICGNDVAEGNVAEDGEECDGTDLRGESCNSLGYYSGSLDCSSCSLDTVGCVLCGDVDVGTYCSSVEGYTIDNEWIEEVCFDGDCYYSGDNGGYFDASDYIFSGLEKGNYYSVDITESDTGGYYEECFSVWVDWNHNSDFEIDEETYIGCGMDEVVSGGITVPIDAMIGATLMRIVGVYSGDYKDVCEDSSGSSSPYNEVEDYTVCVNE